MIYHKKMHALEIDCVIYLFCKGRAWVGKGSNKTPTHIFYFIFLRGLCHYSLRALKFP